MVSPIVGPYVSVNQLSQFKVGHATTSYSAGPVALGVNAFNLGNRFPLPGTAAIASVANQLAQRTIPGTVEQARQAATIAARQLRERFGG